MKNPITSYRALATLALGAALCLPALAGPGAHGPNGEHLGGSVGKAAGAAAALPRLEASSELFELVATLAGGELSILIDRYQSNEPLLNARVEVESGGLKAEARFHADHGDYAVDNPALLQHLASAGEHALVFTIVAGEEADLLDGSLSVSQAAGVHDDRWHEHGWAAWAAWLGAATLAAALLAALALRRRTRGAAGARQLTGDQA